MAFHIWTWAGVFSAAYAITLTAAPGEFARQRFSIYRRKHLILFACIRTFPLSAEGARISTSL